MLKVDGMTCAHCVRGVTTALKSVPGVLSAEVDLATGKADVGFGEGVSIQSLIEAVNSEGYSASEIK